MADLPTGTVTFLFTDIEGSTRLCRAQEGLPLAEAEPFGPYRNLALAMIHHTLGHPTESDAVLQVLSDNGGWTDAFQIAEAHAYRGEVEKAFEWLERAYAQRDPGVVYSVVSVLLKPLHGDPRWTPFLRRLGLR